MRYRILLIALMALSFASYGKNSDTASVEKADYPKYTVDSASNTAFVVFTIEQAQKLDNDEDLLKMYRLLHVGGDSLINVLVVKVKVAEYQTTLLNLKITELEKVNSTQRALVDNLNVQIDDYKKNVSLADEQMSLKDQQLKNVNKELKRQKRLKILGFGVGALGVVIGVLALL